MLAKMPTCILTDDLIDSLSHYYGKAVRENVRADVDKMKKLYEHLFFRLSSTNEKKAHHFCLLASITEPWRIKNFSRNREAFPYLEAYRFRRGM